jgi:hypothetical protein
LISIGRDNLRYSPGQAEYIACQLSCHDQSQKYQWNRLGGFAILLFI